MRNGSNNNLYLEKISSLIVGGAAAHVGQNLITMAATRSKAYAGDVASHFAQGVHGVVDTSVKAGAKNFSAGALAPDTGIARRMAHKLGETISEHLGGMSKRHQVGLRMISEGRFEDLARRNLHNDPKILAAAHAIHGATGIDIPHVLGKLGVKENREAMSKVFGRKDLPLLSNIGKGISRGRLPVGPQFKPGHMGDKASIAGAVASGLVDPAAGVINSTKAVFTNDRVKKTVVGGKVNKFLTEHFIQDPLKKGANDPNFSNIKNRAYGILANPTTAELHRTSHAISSVGR